MTETSSQRTRTWVSHERTRAARPLAPHVQCCGKETSHKGGGRAKHVNYATPTHALMRQHCTLGQGVCNRKSHTCRLRHVVRMIFTSLLLRTFFRQPSRIFNYVLLLCVRYVCRCVLQSFAATVRRALCLLVCVFSLIPINLY